MSVRTDDFFVVALEAPVLEVLALVAFGFAGALAGLLVVDLGMALAYIKDRICSIYVEHASARFAYSFLLRLGLEVVREVRQVRDVIDVKVLLGFTHVGCP
jgi:hypothetical protein